MVRSLFSLLFIGGVVTVAMVAPNVVAAFGKLEQKHRFYSKKNNFGSVLAHLKNRKLITTKDTGGFTQIRITYSGNEYAARLFSNTLKIKKQEPWDGYWWIVIFDIPRKHNSARNALREKLREIGMEQMQDSVFISKYSCTEEVNFLVRLFNVSSFVSIIRADFITNYP